MMKDYRSARWMISVFILLALLSVTGLRIDSVMAVGVQAGEGFDAALFGMPLPEDSPKTHGVRWAESRKVRQVIVDFAGDSPLPNPDTIKLEYWHGRGWDGQADPMVGDPGQHGWSRMDDWTHGEWKQAKGSWRVEGRCWIYTFDSTPTEFPKLKGEGVTYRKTLQIRLRSEEALPAIKHLRVLTDAVLKPLTLRLHFGDPA